MMIGFHLDSSFHMQTRWATTVRWRGAQMRHTKNPSFVSWAKVIHEEAAAQIRLQANSLIGFPP